MEHINKLVETIIEGIQDKKGKKIAVLDLRETESAICDYYIVCEGNNPNQVSAIADSVKEVTREKLNQRVISTDGYNNAIWIAIDFGSVMVHVFQKELRTFYDLDHLWNTVTPQLIADLD